MTVTFAISQQRNRLEQYKWLKKHIDPASSLEAQFLDYLYNSGYRLPDYAQFRPVPEIQVQPDFYYDRGDVPGVCIFVDGPSHDSPETKQHDSQLRKELEDRGFRVIVIRYDGGFEPQVKAHVDIFGI